MTNATRSLVVRRPRETDDEFIARAVNAASRRHKLSIDFGGGVMCLDCAPTTGYAAKGRAELYDAACRCYNCKRG
jgi:hypothetical protein